MKRRLFLLPVLLAGLMLGATMQMNPQTASSADRAYMGAMTRMRGAAMRGPMSGNADRDFLVMMIPHHQAAVEMAKTELQYGKNARVRALARRIITAQTSEIKEMRAWLR